MGKSPTNTDINHQNKIIEDQQLQDNTTDITFHGKTSRYNRKKKNNNINNENHTQYRRKQEHVIKTVIIPTLPLLPYLVKFDMLSRVS